jgi:tRNA pseudouridine13 synthase
MFGLPHAYLTRELPGVGGVIKQEIDDFLVEEVPLYPAVGAGEHTYFEVEKSDLSTLEALERLSRELGKEVREFGFAGLKDRKGITRQTLSISGIAPERLLALELPQIKVLGARRHTNKLRVGHLRGNRFEIRIRNVAPDGAGRVADILSVIARQGMPNYFGPQRFGNRGDAQWVGRALLVRDDRGAVRRILGQPALSERNPRVVAARYLFLQYRWHEALEMFPWAYREEHRLLGYLLRAGENYAGARKVLRPQILRLYFTAYQSYLFNRCLEKRLELTSGDLGRFFEGDVAVLHRNGALFRVEDLAGAAERSRSFEISPSGPIFGSQMLLPEGPQRAIEEEVLAAEGLKRTDFHQLQPHLGLEGRRRPFRVPVGEVEWRLSGNDLYLKFFLPKGSYATTLLRELMKNEEAAPGFLEENGTRGPSSEI